MLFKEIVSASTENHTKPINTLCGLNVELLIIKAGGICSYHWAFRVLNIYLKG
jgi:hypothetical protein